MNGKVKIFLISGLGADKRTFDFLQLDFKHLIHHVSWIPPLENEKIESYCTRLIGKYKIDQNSILIGLSFGGLVSVEISKQVSPLKTIIISSVRNKNDLSKGFRISGKLGMHKLLTEKRIRNSNRYVEKAFGMATYNDRQILSDVLRNTNVEIVQWGIREMINWREPSPNEEIIRIHGRNDRILPLKNQADYVIEDGGHMMIAQRAEEISEILNTEIKSVINY